MSWLRRLAPFAALAAVAGGLYGVAQKIFWLPNWNGSFGPILLPALGLLALFALGSIVFGSHLMRSCLPGKAIDGFWALSFATGAAVFALANGLLGWLQLLGWTSFFLLPMTMMAWGWHSFVAELVAWKAARAENTRRYSALEHAALAFGTLGIVLVGLQTLSVDNVNYDAAWYHLRGAERYALAGGQVRMNDGDVLLILPQTATWLYTWAFLWPSVTIDDRVRLALMLEFATVLGTLAAIPALVRALCPTLPKELTRLSWVAFFFFPTIFVYDTGVMGGADHVVTLWAVSSLLLWLAIRERRSLGGWALFGIHIAGMLAKYSSLYVLVPLAVLVGVDWLLRLRRSAAPRSATVRFGPLVTLCVGLALTSPYWLRNAIWYHNPVYPVATGIFPSTPWIEDAAAHQLNNKESTYWTENGTGLHKLGITAKAMVTYQTELNTWGDLTDGQPIAGSLYFLSLLALPFIQDRRRLLLLLAFIVHAGIAVWFNTHQHQMRYLIILMAPMAAGAAAVGLSLWRSGSIPARLAVLVAVAWHLVAFIDMPFRKTHRMAGRQSTVGIATEFLSNHGRKSARFSGWEQIGASLPPRAVPLVHGTFPHLGIGRQSATDVTAHQFGINYGRWGSQKEILHQLRKMGITHLILNPGCEQSDSVTGEALFLGLASQTVEKTAMHGFTIGELPQQAREIGEGIVYVGCGQLYKSGLYTLDALKEPVPPWFHPFPQATPVEPAVDWRTLLPRASYVAIEADCGQGHPPGGEFTLLNDMTGFPKRLRMFVRTAGAAQGWPAPSR